MYIRNRCGRLPLKATAPARYLRTYDRLAQPFTPHVGLGLGQASGAMTGEPHDLIRQVLGLGRT